MIKAHTDDGRVFMDAVVAAPTTEAAVIYAFAPDGPLARGGYAPRAGQVDMAKLVARSIDNGGQSWRAAQAPTGTGKSLAYLVPGIIGCIRAQALSNTHRPVLVSTASIPLQSQIARKDVPGIAAALGIDVRAAVRKGIGNYVCRDKLFGEALLDLGADKRSALAAQLSALLESGTWSGDRDDLSFDPGVAWGDVSVPTDSCLGEKCAYAKDGTCPAVADRKTAKDADVIVVNHHVLALSGARYEPIVVAIDEGHEFEDALRGTGGAQVTRWSLRSESKRIRAALGPDIERALDSTMERVSRALEGVIGASREDRVQVRSGSVDFGDAPERLTNIARALEGAAEAQDEQTAARWERAADKIKKAALVASKLASADAPGFVHLVEVEGSYSDGRKKVIGRLVPIDVTRGAQRVSGLHGAAVLTSATLSPSGSFGPLSSGLGVTLEETLDLPSPYDLPNMGLTIAPELDAPSPKDAFSWEPWAIDRVVELVRASRGGALVLCSSFKMVREIAPRLRGARIVGRDGKPIDVRMQGEAGRAELRSWFTSNIDGTLVASRSFATGLDVQGDACRLVVIDKPPFPSPKDPVESAVGEMLAVRTGQSAFMARSVPRAAAGLAQACGRLIRTTSDRGVIAILDRRVFDGGGMGDALRASLPAFPVSRSVEDCARFFAGEKPRGVMLNVGGVGESVGGAVRVTGGATLPRRRAGG